MFANPVSGQNFTISNIQWPQLNYTMCTQSDVYVNIIRSCYNSTYSGSTVNVVGFNITVDVNYSVTGTCNAILDFPGHQISLGILPAGTYTVLVNANLNSSTHSTMGSSLVVGVGNCCPLNADAGNDSVVCKLDSIQLNGNSIPSFGSGKWTVVSGNATIIADSIPNPWAYNLSNGINTFSWKITDSICADSATVKFTKFALPSDAIVEIDKKSCFDTISIHATQPTVGTGKWTTTTTGVVITNSTSSVAQANNLTIGFNELIWTVSNNICPKNIDTLIVEYDQLVDSPIVSLNGFTLSSDPQPTYQWHKDQVAIPNETNQTYNVTSNGTYSVFSTVVDCENGLFSNEIEIDFVGIEESDQSGLNIYPNPVLNTLTIESAQKGQFIIVNNLGKEVLSGQLKGTQKLDLSQLNSGIYFIRLITNNKQSQKRFIKQ